MEKQAAAALRIAFYCHNTYGLGHVTRSLRIADAATALGAECMVITGCRHLSKLQCPAGVGVHALSPAKLDVLGRPLPMDDGTDDIVAHRAGQIMQFSRAWHPHAFLVDQHPLGLGGELKNTLLDESLNDMHVFWGLPYAEGVPTRKYRDPSLALALSRYECLLAYGDKSFEDIVMPFDPEMLPPRVEYTGIIASKPQIARSTKRDRLVVLCGGGFGASEFYQLILNAFKLSINYSIRIIAGPASDEQRLRELAQSYGAEILSGVTLDQSLENAAAVISRVGYNTAFHLIQTELPLIFIPQELGHDDQPNRASKLSKFHNVWVVREKDDNFTAELNFLTKIALQAEHTPRRVPLQLDGPSRAAEILNRISNNGH